VKQRLAQINPDRVYFHETSPFSALYTSLLQRFRRRTIPLATSRLNQFTLESMMTRMDVRRSFAFAVVRATSMRRAGTNPNFGSDRPGRMPDITE